ncbi:hypothetical protein MMC22_000177 [Lobaria immixta]|nr:hypothetical protein [Lobaria immixta]
MPLAPYVKNPTTSMTALAELQKSKKLKTIKISPTYSGVRPAYQDVSKLADSKGEKYIVLAKCIFKPATISKPKAELVNETKPLDLTFIAKTLINLKTVVPKKYHKFFDVFSKEVSDTLLPHSKYNHRIHLLEKYKDHSNSFLSKMFEPKLQFVKKFLKEHPKKEFIKASSAPCHNPEIDNFGSW